MCFDFPVTLIGALWEIDLPVSFDAEGFGYPLQNLSNLGVSLILGALLYYSSLSIPLALGMLIVSTLSIMSVIALNELSPLIGLNLLELSLGLFVVAWIGQFIGHKIEGKKPSFLEDIQFLLIGPLWLLSFIYRRLGINY